MHEARMWGPNWFTHCPACSPTWSDSRLPFCDLGSCFNLTGQFKCRIASSSLTLCMTHVGQITWLGCMSICLNMFLTLMCLTLLSKCVPSKKYCVHLHSSSRILLFISRSNFGSRASSYWSWARWASSATSSRSPSSPGKRTLLKSYKKPLAVTLFSMTMGYCDNFGQAQNTELRILLCTWLRECCRAQS